MEFGEHEIVVTIFELEEGNMDLVSCVACLSLQDFNLLHSDIKLELFMFLLLRAERLCLSMGCG